MDLDFKELKIDYNEVLRYLEYKGQIVSEELEYIINECINLTKTKVDPRYMLRVYPINRYTKDDNVGNLKYTVEISNTNLKLDSKDIYELLDGCNECILMATTIGIEIEREIKKYTYKDLTRGVILDSCATTAIESMCNLIESQIRKELSQQGKNLTSRYSPGYGDLSIEANKQVVDILKTQNNIGLTITQSNIMLPRKSVIAILGISDLETNTCKKSCSTCNNYNNCKYRKEVEGCEH